MYVACVAVKKLAIGLIQKKVGPSSTVELRSIENVDQIMIATTVPRVL